MPGVTSDTRQITSARSADRFKGFRDFPAGLTNRVKHREETLPWGQESPKGAEQQALYRGQTPERRRK